MAAIPELTDANFAAEVIASPIPVLVDFGSTWCPPCKQLAPIVEQIAKDYAGRLKVVGVNIETAPETAIRYGIMNVPTVVFFKNGAIEDKTVGFQSRPALDGRLTRLLG